MNKTVENTSLKTNAETVAIVAARAADDKQGSNILVLNVGDVLAITDRRGNETFVPTAKIAYVELGSQEGSRSIDKAVWRL